MLAGSSRPCRLYVAPAAVCRSSCPWRWERITDGWKGFRQAKKERGGSRDPPRPSTIQRAPLPVETEDELNDAARVLLNRGDTVVVRIRARADDRHEVRMVERVQHFAAELERRPSDQPNALHCAQVDARVPRTR